MGCSTSTLAFFLITLMISGCASLSRRDDTSTLKGWSATSLHQATCEIGQNIETANGTLWLKSNSKNMRGQFNAEVLAKAPEELRLEVTHFFGGVVALISVQGNHIEVTGKNNEPISDPENGTWGSIPLRLASQLLLGRFPCPKPSDHLTIELLEPNQLLIETQEKNDLSDQNEGHQKFLYTFTSIKTKTNQAPSSYPWPQSLHWETNALHRRSSITSIDLTFDTPEEATKSPLSWEARSQEGTLKVKWKERHITMH